MKYLKSFIAYMLVLAMLMSQAVYADSAVVCDNVLVNEPFTTNNVWINLGYTYQNQSTNGSVETHNVKADSPIADDGHGKVFKGAIPPTNGSAGSYTISEQHTVNTNAALPAMSKWQFNADILMTERARMDIGFRRRTSSGGLQWLTVARMWPDGCLTREDGTQIDTWNIDTWYSFDVSLNLDEQKYTMKLNDTIVANDLSFVNVSGFTSIERMEFTIQNTAVPNAIAADSKYFYLDNLKVATVYPPPVVSETIYDLTQLVTEDNFDNAGTGSYTGGNWEYKQHSSISHDIVAESTGKFFQTNIPAAEASDNMFASLGDLVTKSAYKDSQYWLAEYDIRLSARGRVYLNMVGTKEDGSVAISSLAWFNESGIFALCGGAAPSHLSNYNKYKNYETNKWYPVKLYINLVADTFSLWINDEPITIGTALPAACKNLQKIRVDMSKAQGTPEQDGNTKVSFDNFKLYCPSSFSLLSTTPVNNKGDVLPDGTVSLTFSNPVIDTFTSSDFVLKDSQGTDVSGFNVSKSGNSVTLDFSSSPLAFGTAYTLSTADTLKDVFGQTLGTPASISFTTAEQKAYAPSAEFEDASGNTLLTLPSSGSVKAVANIKNPTADPIDVTMIVNVYDTQGKLETTIKDAPVTVSASGNADASCTIADISAYTGKSLKSFAISGTELITEGASALASAEQSVPSPTGKQITIAADTLGIYDTELRAVGSVTPKEVQPILLTAYALGQAAAIAESPAPAGTLSFADVIYTNADGAFDFSIDLSSVLQNTKYSVTLNGRQASAVSDEMIYLLSSTRNSIRDSINNASSATAVQTVFADSISNNLLIIDSAFLTTNGYQTVFEQRPYSQLSDALTMLEKAKALPVEYNTLDWSSLGSFISANSDILFYGCTSELSYYNGFSANDKNRVHQKMVEGGNAADITAIRSCFKTAVSQIISENEAQTESDSYNYYGGGGGGGTYSGEVVSKNPSVTPTQPQPNKYNDLDTVTWAKEYIETLSEAGIVSGDGKGNFRPLDNVKREEYVKMLVLALGIDLGGYSADFYDMSADAWYTPYIAGAVRAGIVNGDTSGNFGIGKQITREDMAVMAYRALTYLGIELPHTEASVNFTDQSDISDYAKNAVSQMQLAGILSGTDTGSILPKDSGNRAQAAKIICEIFNMLGRGVK